MKLLVPLLILQFDHTSQILPIFFFIRTNGCALRRFLAIAKTGVKALVNSGYSNLTTFLLDISWPLLFIILTKYTPFGNIEKSI